MPARPSLFITWVKLSIYAAARSSGARRERASPPAHSGKRIKTHFLRMCVYESCCCCCCCFPLLNRDGRAAQVISRYYAIVRESHFSTFIVCAGVDGVVTFVSWNHSEANRRMPPISQVVFLFVSRGWIFSLWPWPGPPRSKARPLYWLFSSEF